MAYEGSWLTEVAQQLDLAQDALGVDQVLEYAGDALDGDLQAATASKRTGRGWGRARHG